LGVFPFLGCGCLPPELKYDALKAELDANRARWNAAGIRSYEYHYDRICFCPPASGVVRVEDGQVVSARLDTGRELDASEAADFPTVDQLFDGIQSAIDQNYASIQVEFDPTVGYPTRISIVTAFFITDAGVTETAGDLVGM
jgi:hypothetical protein